MTVSFDLPPEIEQSLRRSTGDLNHAAKEAALIELYRQEQLTHHELSEALNLSRLETDALLKTHNVTEDLLSPAEFERQAADLQRLMRQ